MSLVREVCLAAVCAFGLAFAAWWLIGRLLRPIPAKGIRIIIPARGDGEGLEQSLRALVWLRSLGLLNCPVILADISLSPDGRELALRLAYRWPGVTLRKASSLPDCLAREA